MPKHASDISYEERIETLEAANKILTRTVESLLETVENLVSIVEEKKSLPTRLNAEIPGFNNLYKPELDNLYEDNFVQETLLSTPGFYTTTTGEFLVHIAGGKGWVTESLQHYPEDSEEVKKFFPISPAVLRKEPN